MENKYIQAKEILKKYGQEQLLINYDKFSDKDKEKLLNQILNIDFELVLSLYEKTKEQVNFGESKIEPIEYTDKEKISNKEYEEYYNLGKNIIQNNQYAVVTMAGGQGTRLGHKAPKGTFTIGKGVSKSLFEALSDTIKEANEEFGVEIPWYIMTSEENNIQTISFFEENKYFGLNKNNVIFFTQGKLPMVGTNGKILIDEKGFVKEAADGHGGVFESMARNHVIEDMEKRNIKWIFIAGVDNVLAKMVDPIATGLAIKKGVLATGKSVVKRNPSEKVGVFCKKNGKPYVVEYTEISKEMSEKTDKNGELLFGESHIITNLFNIEALKEISKNKLPYHIAFKKANYMNEIGEIVISTEPNAYKFESFIFDAFERLEDMAILRVKREEEFAPVKNADGLDSPDTARELYLNYIENKNNLKKIEYSKISKVINIEDYNNTIENINKNNIDIMPDYNVNENKKIDIKQAEQKVAAKNIIQENE